MSKYERGSEWRRWDLHIHCPQTKLNNQYSDNWDKFSEKLHKSDVSVFGITDYFSITNYDTFLKKFNEKYPDSNKVFFPNIEFRIDSKNSTDEHIQCHVLFSNQQDTVQKISHFLTRLPLVSTDDTHLTSKHCTSDDLLKVTYKKAMVTINKLTNTLSESFSKDEYIIVGVVNGYGSLRPGQNDGRGEEYAKELDKKCHAFFGVRANVDFYLNNETGRTQFDLPPKPVLWGSDCHSFTEIEGRLGQFFTWIKADLTFEGLRQTLYEPEGRVKIQDNKPDEKAGYQVIDSVEIDNMNIKQTIQFNANLNTIIGGRSTGKSTLLQLLALKIDPKISLKDNKEFIESMVSGANVKWKDGEINKERDIEFFPQSHMYDIARDLNRKDELIQEIIKNRPEQQELDKYNGFCVSNKENIQANIDNLFQLQDDISKNNISLKEKGDKEGLETEIRNINNTILEIKRDSNLSDDDEKKFGEIRKYIANDEQYIQASENDKTHISSLKNKSLFNQSIIYKLHDLSEHSVSDIEKIFKDIEGKITKLWANQLDEKLTKIDIEIKKRQKRIVTNKEQQVFKKGEQHIVKNKQYSELIEKLKIEQQKLQEIKGIEEQIKKLSISKNALFDIILNQHIDYSNKIIALQDKFILEHDNIEIKIYRQFLEKKCEGLLTDCINLQSHDRKKYVDKFPENYQENTKETIKEFLEKALNKKIELKAYKEIKDLTKGLLIENWFSLSYELTYQGDSFAEMSDGKKAFVILKLLLDFSEKKCPILIDQPEDSLDNRAIYNELVTYIKSKKTQRQIILVTHNANVVVNADAEEIIVANQQGKDSKNKDKIKFQYISGSLENTKSNTESNIVLNSQGIKEHACEILEGGTEAFKKRECKYGI